MATVLDDFTRIVTRIRSVTREQYRKYKPELLENGHTIPGLMSGSAGATMRPDAYEKLMRKQRQIVYKKDITQQIKVEEAQKRCEELQKSDDLRQHMAQRINFRSAKEEMVDHQSDLQRPWNKLSNNLRIQAVLKFIEAITPHLKEPQINQLKYLLIAAVSQRTLNKLSEIDYDIMKGQILKIHRLVLDGDEFKLLDIADVTRSVGLASFQVQAVAVVEPAQKDAVKPRVRLVLKRAAVAN